MAGALLLATVASAATPEDYTVKTARELVTLCSTDPGAPDYATAIAFCHGFAVGAYQYYLQSTAASKARFVCPPAPPPTRTQAIADFLAWMRQHPEAADAAPVDAMFRGLAEKYPCRS